MEQENKEEKDQNEPKTITVQVNEKPVSFSVHKTSGLQIKETAINQGVSIQIDFNLFEVEGNNLKPIRDDEEVTLHPHENFRAVTSDDNS